MVGGNGAGITDLDGHHYVDFVGEFSAGLFGQTTSLSPFLSSPMQLQYQGHVTRKGIKQTMRGSLPEIDSLEFDIPVILIVGRRRFSGHISPTRLEQALQSRMI